MGLLTGPVNQVQVRIECLRSHGRPRRNEEQCTGALLNLAPLGNKVGSLEGRDERLVVNLELGRAVLVGVDKVRNLGNRPRSTAKLNRVNSSVTALLYDNATFSIATHHIEG